MFTPHSLDGLEVDPITCARVIEEVSRADSAAGWSLQNPLSWAFMCSRLPDGGAEELFCLRTFLATISPQESLVPTYLFTCNILCSGRLRRYSESVSREIVHSSDATLKALVIRLLIENHHSSGELIFHAADDPEMAARAERACG